MPSMTPMMSTILREESLIEPMVATTCATTAPPLPATVDALAARPLASWAFCAFCWTVPVSSSIDEAVSSSELACCSVRADKSRLPEAIWRDAVAMVCVPPRTSLTMRSRLAVISCKACISSPVSSRERTSTRTVRSPCATCLATSMAERRGRLIFLANHMATSAASTSVTRPPPSKTQRVCACRLATACERCASKADSACPTSLSSARMASMPALPRPCFSSASTGSMAAVPCATARRRAITGSSAPASQAFWAASSFARRSCCAGLSLVRARALSRCWRNAALPAAYGSSEESAPVIT
ncbi:hypothetical protein JaAD80_26370 [Janthinobacterium sp. AD80]|nr:hypothetical protein JaAD80_26370 [Janthinobacterium sp. AD80]